MKRIIVLITSVAMILALFTFNVSAASASVSVSNSNPKVNNAVTVTVTVKGNEAMYGTDFSVSYNPEVLRFESGDDAAGGAGVVKIAGGVTGAVNKAYSLKFTAIASGSSSISASGGIYYENSDDSFSGSATVNVSDESKSTNANLTSLSVSAGVLSPKFSTSVTEYNVTVESDVTECKVYGTTADPDANISVSGSATLKVGVNKRVVIVTAPSGATKSYTLTITRKQAETVSKDTTSKVTSSNNTASKDVTSKVTSSNNTASKDVTSKDTTSNGTASKDTSDVSSESQNVSSENTSSTDEGTTAALMTEVNGLPYMVVKDISNIKLPNGFTVTERLYNNETISVATDINSRFELFYLKSADSDTAYPYFYDSDSNIFERVQIITQMDNSYIVSELPENCSLPDNYISANVKIEDISVDCYSNTEEQSADMFYIYCYYNGEFGMYRYDKLEGVLQRYPELKVIESDETEVVSDGSIIDRFAVLSSNAKTIVVCIAIAVLGVIALIVLLIVKLVKNSKTKDYDYSDDEDDFDSVTFNDDYEIAQEDMYENEAEEDSDDAE